MTDLEKRLKNLEDMFSISRKNQPKNIGQMNANDERFDKIEKIIVKIQEKLEISNNSEESLLRTLDFSEKAQDTTLQLESANRINENENMESQIVNNFSYRFL